MLVNICFEVAMYYLLVIDRIETGGAERILLDYRAYLEAAGHRVGVFALYAVDNERCMEGVAYGRVGDNSGNPLKKMAQQRTIKRRLQQFIDEQRPDRIFSFLERSNLLVASIRSRAQKVVSVHNVLSIQYDKIPNGLIRRAAQQMIRRAYNRNDIKVVAVSGQVRDDLVHRFGVDPQQITVINNRVDAPQVQRLAQEEPTEFVFDPQHTYLIHVGRFTLQKAQWKLVKAMRWLADHRAELKIKLLLVGQGEDRTHIEQLALRLGVADRVAILPFTPNPYRLIARADWVVMPSLYEGFPITVAEAVALGKPFLGSRKAIPCELFTDAELYRSITYDNDSIKADFSDTIGRDDETLARLITHWTVTAQSGRQIVEGYARWAAHNDKNRQFDDYCVLYDHP